MDNARIHRGGRIEQIVSAAACSLLYLSPYSPDFNPIELAWAWIKRFVRQRVPREVTSRLEAIQEALAALPATFAIPWFRKCGIDGSGQS